MTVSYNSNQQKSSPLENARAFVNIATRSIGRHSPLHSFINKIQYGIYIILTFQQKLQQLKNRVNHLNYRLYEMEQTINKNNPNNFKKGSVMNQIR